MQSTGQCENIDLCTGGDLYIAKNGVCSECVWPCLKCSAEGCLSCSDEFYLIDKECKNESCPATYFLKDYNICYQVELGELIIEMVFSLPGFFLCLVFTVLTFLIKLCLRKRLSFVMTLVVVFTILA
jgi:hypothetical protein